jgi:hypothetical protein
MSKAQQPQASPENLHEQIAEKTDARDKHDHQPDITGHQHISGRRNLQGEHLASRLRSHRDAAGHEMAPQTVSSLAESIAVSKGMKKPG